MPGASRTPEGTPPSQQLLANVPANVLLLGPRTLYLPTGYPEYAFFRQLFWSAQRGAVAQMLAH